MSMVGWKFPITLFKYFIFNVLDKMAMFTPAIFHVHLPKEDSRDNESNKPPVMRILRGNVKLS